MTNSISIDEWFETGQQEILLDVRTPAEYTKGHIPGAHNIPLFYDDERAMVGTIYKEISKEKAFEKGLEIVGPRLNWYIKQARAVAPDRKVTVHCWRGGQRSRSIAMLLDAAGFNVSTLKGGYKSYRNFILKEFELRHVKFIVLGGKTGSGKTEILKHLKWLGEQVIDLEQLAHHKGSAFGALGELPQPSVEQFENALFEEFRKIEASRRTWVENESRSIGKIFIPEGFWTQMKSAPLIHLEIPLKERIHKLVEVYANYPVEELRTALLKIEKRMGGQNVKAALSAFDSKDVTAATELILEYYDKAYLHATAQGNFSSRFHLEMSSLEPKSAARSLIEFADQNYL